MAKLDDDGKVITGPYFKATNPMKKGNVDAILFSRPTYNAIGDPFKMAGASMARTTKKNGHIDAGHEKAFMPAKTSFGLKGTESNSVGIKPPYAYMPQGVGPKKDYKDEEGNVRTAPPNMKVMKGKIGKVGKFVTLGGNIDYISDPYDAKKILA